MRVTQFAIVWNPIDHVFAKMSPHVLSYCCQSLCSMFNMWRVLVLYWMVCMWVTKFCSKTASRVIELADMLSNSWWHLSLVMWALYMQFVVVWTTRLLVLAAHVHVCNWSLVKQTSVAPIFKSLAVLFALPYGWLVFDRGQAKRTLLSKALPYFAPIFCCAILDTPFCLQRNIRTYVC